MITAPLFECQKKLRGAGFGRRVEETGCLLIRRPKSAPRNRPAAGRVRRQFFTRSGCAASSSAFFAASAGAGRLATGMK